MIEMKTKVNTDIDLEIVLHNNYLYYMEQKNFCLKTMQECLYGSGTYNDFVKLYEFYHKKMDDAWNLYQEYHEYVITEIAKKEGSVIE